MMSWQRSEHESMVSRFWERSRVWSEGHSTSACTSVAKAASLMDAPRRRACCRSRCLIHWSTTRMSFVETWLLRSRRACSSSWASLPPRLPARGAGAVPSPRSWIFRSSFCDSAWTWSRLVTSSSSCRVILTILPFRASTSEVRVCAASAFTLAAERSDSTLASSSAFSFSCWLRTSASSRRRRVFSSERFAIAAGNINPVPEAGTKAQRTGSAGILSLNG
mmetsp:Transcript_10986/g.29336  ORF Transcript_10986/g.29336 Transcript_10986/m.29336 type:complete len:221 (+) Transcript_10986:1554-2216(+)